MANTQAALAMMAEGIQQLAAALALQPQAAPAAAPAPVAATPVPTPAPAPVTAWTPDWNNPYQNKFSFTVTHRDGTRTAQVHDHQRKMKPGVTYYSTRDEAQAAADAFLAA